MISLASSPIGSVVAISGTDHRFGEDYTAEAFIPDDLPTTLDLPGSVWQAVAHAAQELGRIDAAARLVPNPQLITRIATRREAIGTSALEGTYANLTDLFAADALSADEDASLDANVREVLNYTRAADRAYAWVAERPITVGLLSNVHAMIVSGTPSDTAEAGNLRRTQVFIGNRGRRVGDATFIPCPPGDQLRGAYDRWVDWLTDPAAIDNVHLIVRVALAHYQFEVIHPYNDGNGRVGRLVIALQLLREGALRAPVVSLSASLKDRGDEYRAHLLRVSQTGDWGPWVTFLAEAIAAEARAGHDRITDLLALKEQITGRVRAALPRARLALEIAEQLIAYPILSVAMAHAQHGRTNQANRNAIGQLVDLGVLQPYSTGGYDRLYWSRDVFTIIDR